MRIVATIEARMDSTRLPGKALADIDGVTAIGRIVSRLRRVKSLHDIILATTGRACDDALADWARANEIGLFRGGVDQKARLEAALDAYGHQWLLVRVWGDMPCVDPSLIAAGIAAYFNGHSPAVSNIGFGYAPTGMEVWVGNRLDVTPAETAILRHGGRFARSDIRVVLDNNLDLKNIRWLYKNLGPTFGAAELIEFVDGMKT